MILFAVLCLVPAGVAAAMSNIGFLHLLKGEEQLAEQAWTGAHVYAPGYRPAQEGLIRVYVTRSDFGSAQPLLGQMRQGPGIGLSAWLNMTAQRFLTTGNIQQAVAILDSLAGRQPPNDPRLWYKMGNLYRKTQAYDQARICYLKGIQQDPMEDLAEGWFYLAQSASYLNDWQQVVDTLSVRLSGQPDLPPGLWPWPHWQEAFWLWGYGLKQLGRYPEAESIAWRAYRQDPENRTLLLQLILMDLGDEELQRDTSDLARKHFLRSYEIALTIEVGSRRDYEQFALERFLNYATWVKQEGSVSTAKLWVEDEITHYSDQPNRYVLLGALYEVECEKTSAVRAYQEAFRLAPHSLYLADYIRKLLANTAGTNCGQ